MRKLRGSVEFVPTPARLPQRRRTSSTRFIPGRLGHGHSLPGPWPRRPASLTSGALFGFATARRFPPLAARVEGIGSRFAGRVGVKSGGDGFWAGVGLGISLGILYPPCAGPILAGVLTFSASQSFHAGRLAVIVA